MLRQDLIPAAESQEGTELLQIQDATKKLSAYKHLFNEHALAEFNQLADAVDPATGEWNDAATDNTQGALNVEHGVNNAGQRNILGGGLTEQILALLDHLENHLNESIKELESAEVRAAWDLAVWLQDSEDEKHHLDNEEVKKNTYLDKLNISVQAARAHENKAWEIYFQSASSYNNAVTHCIHLGEAYLEDKHKRDDEAGLIEEVIKMFKDNVSSLKGTLWINTNWNLSFIHLHKFYNS